MIRVNFSSLQANSKPACWLGSEDCRAWRLLGAQNAFIKWQTGILLENSHERSPSPILDTVDIFPSPTMCRNASILTTVLHIFHHKQNLER